MELIEPRRSETVVADPRWVVALAWVLLPVVGGWLGWMVVPAARWLVSVDRLPMPGAVQLLAELPQPEARLIALAVGVVAGVLLVLAMLYDSLRVVIANDRVTLTRKGSSKRVERATVAMVFIEDGRLVLLDAAGRELVRERVDFGAGHLAEGFGGHGWPWRADGDPYRDAYRRWVPGAADLPAGADALFKARQRALERGDSDDAADLRTELGRLDVVVRDDKKRQYWRASVRP